MRDELIPRRLSRRPVFDRAAMRPYAVLLAACVLPLLWTRPGRVNSDTSDRVLTDPAAALAAVVTRWDPGVSFGILRDRTYDPAFPMAPFYAVADVAGLPIWLAQRIWLAILLFAAGAGVMQLLRTMRWDGPGPLSAAIVYVFTPYTVVNLGTSSGALLAWAGLPWLIAATVAALEDRPGGDWRYPARFAVVAALVGCANLAAFTYVLVGPMLWIAYSVAATREVDWRRALAVSSRIVGASLAVLAWRIVGLMLRPVAELEALQTRDPAGLVAEASGASRLLRGIGHWATAGIGDITAGRGYLDHPALAIATLVLPAFALFSFGRERFHNRVFFVALIAAGLVLGVGMAPRDAPEAYGRIIKGVVDTRLGAILLPTARATPLVLLGVAVGTAVGIRSLISAFPAGQRFIQYAAFIPAVLTVPSFPLGMALDGERLREDIPQYWLDAAEYLDRPEHDGYAVLELPGLAASTYTWGATVEPISFTLIDRPVALRTLERSAQAGSADLLAAIDAAARNDRLSANAVAPLARLMGVDSILVRGDTRTPDNADQDAAAKLNQLLDGAPGIGAPVAFHTGGIVPELTVYPVLDPEPMIRLIDRTRTLAVSGTGAALVGLANLGVIHGDEAVVYSASLTPEEFARLPDRAPVIVTDSSRWTDVDKVGLDRAEATLSASFPSARIVRSDQPNLFPREVADAFSSVRYDGVAGIGASSYGAVDRIQPEFRPGRAFDGDLGTKWIAGLNGDPVGARLTIDTISSVSASEIVLRQPDEVEPFDTITKVRLIDVTNGIDDGDTQSVSLTAESLTVGRRVALDPALRRAGELAIEIVEVQGGDDPGPGAGFAEVEIPGLEVFEVVAVPTDTDRFDGVARHPLAFVFERWASGAGFRDEPESHIARRFELTSTRTFEVEVEVRPPAGESLTIDTGCLAANPILEIDGRPVDLRLEPGVLARRGQFDLVGSALTIAAGTRQLVTALPEDGCGLTVERIVLSDRVGPVAGPDAPAPNASIESSTDTSLQLNVGRLRSPMWLDLGVSYDDDWVGTGLPDLGPATLLNGHSVAWLVPSETAEPFVFAARWTPQRVVNVGVIVSAVAMLIAVGLAVVPTRRRRRSATVVHPVIERARIANPNLIVLAALATFGLAGGPIPAIAAGTVALTLEQRPHLRRPLAWVAPGLLAIVGVAERVAPRLARRPAHVLAARGIELGRGGRLDRSGHRGDHRAREHRASTGASLPVLIGPDAEHRRVRFNRELEVADRAVPHPVEPQAPRSLEVPGVMLEPPLGDQRMRDVVPGREPGPGPPALADGQRWARLQHIEPTVVRVASWGHVPVAEELGVHHRDDRTEPPAPPGDQMRCEPMIGVIDPGPADVDREQPHHPLTGLAADGRSTTRSGRTGRPGEAPGAHEARWDRPSRAPALIDEPAEGTLIGEIAHIVWDGCEAAPLLSPFDRHGSSSGTTRLDAATTPRNSRPAAAAAVRRVSWSGAVAASWSSRSISCFTVRTKSPPESSSDSTTSAKPSPAAHAWAIAKNAGSGVR